MAVRLVITINAAPAKVANLRRAFKRAAKNPQDRLPAVRDFPERVRPANLRCSELWESQEALDAHAKLRGRSPPLPGRAALSAPASAEDYQYNRTR